MSNYNEVFWLNVTNLVLGLVTLACVLVIAYVAFREIRERARANAAVRAEADDHAFVVSGLGVTMADGGEKIDNDDMLVVTEDGIKTASSKKNSPEEK